MKQTINFTQFFVAFQSIRPENFTHDGLKVLFDYLEQYGEECKQELELDVIAFCVDYTEYKNLAELQENYTDVKTMEDLQDHTTVIEIPNSDGFIIQDY